MFKKLIVLLLVLRMAMPLGAEEKIIRSLSDQGETTQQVVPARPILIPVPEVPPVPSVPPEITFELYELPASAVAAPVADPNNATKVFKVGDHIATGFSISSDSGCSYVVTAAHVVNGIKPDDVISFGSHSNGQIVAKDINADLAVIEFPEQVEDGVFIHESELKVGDTITVIGGDGTPENKITTTTHKVVVVEPDTFFVDGPAVEGRSGAGAYINGELVGVFIGVVRAGKDVPVKWVNKQMYTKAKVLVSSLTPVKYPVTVYGSPVATQEKVVDVTTQNFATETAKGMVMLDFWATWCIPCLKMSPILESLKNVKIAKINIDRNPELAFRFKIESIPRFVLLRDGVVVDDGLTGVQTRETLQALVDKYSGTAQLAKLQAQNDKRLVVTYSDAPIPEKIAKTLKPGHIPVVPVWNTSVSDTSFSWPAVLGAWSVDQVIDMGHQSKIATYSSGSNVMGGRWRRQQQEEQPVGSVQCAQQIDMLFGWFEDHLKNHATGRALLHRSGARTFNLYGGKATDLKLETLLGKTGGLELAIDYPADTPEEMKLCIRELKFGFMFDGDDVVFTIDSVRVIGMVRMVDGKIATLQLKDGEQAKGFIGVLTLLSILSWVHTIYVVLHPIADMELGGEIGVSAQRTDDDNIVINFDKGKQPFVKIRSLMTFNLGINQILINKAAKTIIAKFDGTIFAKQYTLHYK